MYLLSSRRYGDTTAKEKDPTLTRVLNDVFCLSSVEWEDVSRGGARFDIVIAGSGFCGYAVAERALRNDPFCRILMLERGPFFLPDHFQNLPLPFRHVLDAGYEIYPWSLSKRMSTNKGERETWLHGVVPCVGGKSTLWSAWCPTPTKEELQGWPVKTQRALFANIEDAKRLLSVRNANEIHPPGSATDGGSPGECVFGELQAAIDSALAKAKGTVTGIYRTEPAALASAKKELQGVDFAKFALPEELLKLVSDQEQFSQGHGRSPFSLVTNCVVEKVLRQHGKAVALQTSRGRLPLANAKLVLATGTLPSTTLVSNSFPELSLVGSQFSAHSMSSIVAQVPIEQFNGKCGPLQELEIAACYTGGLANGSYNQQYHIQMSVFWNKDPEQNEERAFRCMPDAFGMASAAQVQQSKGHIIFVCVSMGELDVQNEGNWFRSDAKKSYLTRNSILQVQHNKRDLETWTAMEQATFDILEKVFATDQKYVKYWHGTKTAGQFRSERPTIQETRVDALVHESSTMQIGEADNALVDTKYKLLNTQNVYITGGALWPRGGSWNPTLSMVALSQDLADHLVPKTV